MFQFQKTIVTGFAILVSLTFGSSANADIILVFNESLTGGVDVIGIGSGMSTANTTSSDFDSQDYNTDFLADTFTASIVPATTTIGTLTNITTGIAQAITGFRVDRDTTSADDIDFQTAAALTFSIGDEFSFDMNASFDVGALAYSDLIIGRHTEDGGEFADENFGQYSVLIGIPEPSSFSIIGFALLGLGFKRRSRNS